MQKEKKTAGETATVTLVMVRSCHVRENVAIENVRPGERPMYERFATRHGFLVAVRKPKEPTCDNCANMTVRHTGSGNHRHCDLMGLYIPDNEQSPTCDLHMAISKFERLMSAKGKVKENRLRKGGLS